MYSNEVAILQELHVYCTENIVIQRSQKPQDISRLAEPYNVVVYELDSNHINNDLTIKAISVFHLEDDIWATGQKQMYKLYSI